MYHMPGINAKFFLLGYSCFTMLLVSTVQRSEAEFPVLYSRFLLVIFLYILVCIYQSQSPNLSHHHPPLSPLRVHTLFSTSLSLFLPCKPVHLYHFSTFHIYALIYGICFSLSDFTLYDSLEVHPHLYK